MVVERGGGIFHGSAVRNGSRRESLINTACCRDADSGYKDWKINLVEILRRS